MEKQNKNEQPEVYALRQNGGDWQFSRRDFLKAAGMGAAAISAGMSSGCSRSKPLDEVCKEITSTQGSIKNLFASQDGRYLLSHDIGNNSQGVEEEVLTCWNFENHSLSGKKIRKKQSKNQEFNFRFAVSCIDEKQIVAVRENGNGQILELPEQDSGELKYAGSLNFANFDEPISFQIDKNRKVYASYFDKILSFQADDRDNYELDEALLFDVPDGNLIDSIRLFDQERKLFIKFRDTIDLVEIEKGFGVMDLETGDLKVFDGFCWAYAILSNRKQALICSRQKYRLVSLEDGSTEWTQDVPKADEKSNWYINSAAVTPDNSTGILLGENDGRYIVYLISLEDGSQIRSYDLGERIAARYIAGPVVNADGSQAAVSVSDNLFFFSLPDLRLIACPTDLKVLWYNKKGIEAAATDPVTGEKYTVTMPCGAAIPSGAVCTCNCVAGSACACVGHNRGGGGSGGGHYWHPN